MYQAKDGPNGDAAWDAAWGRFVCHIDAAWGRFVCRIFDAAWGRFVCHIFALLGCGKQSVPMP